MINRLHDANPNTPNPSTHDRLARFSSPLCCWPLDTLQVPDVVYKSDLCRLLLKADRLMMKAFLRDHRAQAAARLEQGGKPACPGSQSACPGSPSETMLSEHRTGDNQDHQELEHKAREGTYEEGGEEPYLSGMSVTTGGISLGSTKIDEDTSPSRPGEETWRYTEETRKVFARLEEAAEV